MTRSEILAYQMQGFEKEAMNLRTVGKAFRAAFLPSEKARLYSKGDRLYSTINRQIEATQPMASMTPTGGRYRSPGAVTPEAAQKRLETLRSRRQKVHGAMLNIDPKRFMTQRRTTVMPALSSAS